MSKKDQIEAKIEYQKVIGEIEPGGYRPIRFTKIKYKVSEETHIDIRQFQRGYDENGEEVYYPTKIGFRFLEYKFNNLIKKYTLLPKTYVHPKIIEKCFNLLNNKELESAVFQAFKLIEINVREKINAQSEEVGIKLLRKAFHPDKGLLTDYNLPKAEREAFANYLAGAFGYYKNPCSHRDIEIDFISAFDRIVVASDLLKIIDRAQVATREL